MTSERIAIGRRQLGLLGAGLAAAATGLRATPGTMPEAAAAPAPDAGSPIKIGILHSLSGTMAISETTLKDVMLMLIAEQNAKGGLLGRKLEPVVVDPASNWPLFAEKARALLSVDKVAAVFGCWTSVSRKSVLPVFEELNGILFYPVQYEGQECSRNVFYTGAAPNKQAIPAVDYLMRWVRAWAQQGIVRAAARPAPNLSLDGRGLDAQDLRQCGELVALRLNTGGELGRIQREEYTSSIRPSPDRPQEPAPCKRFGPR